MKKLLIITIITISASVFFGGCGEVHIECVHSLNIIFWTSSNVDSVAFYLNNEQICRQRKTTKINGKAAFFLLCKTTTDNVLDFVELNNNHLCLPSDSIPLWNIIECEIDEKQYGNPLDSVMISTIAYAEENISESRIFIPAHSFYELSNGVSRGVQYSVMFERDTTKWNLFRSKVREKNVAINVNYDYFNFSVLWDFLSCTNNVCYFSTEHFDDEVCYEL